MPVIVALSGGMDSATLLGTLCRHYSFKTDICAVTFDYGSKHGRYEQEAANKLATHYGILSRHYTIDVHNIFQHTRSALLCRGGAIPEGHYQTESMTLTVVPGRNLIFASILSAMAESIAMKGETATVYLGVHAGDHAIYPDCRPLFISSLAETVRHSSEGRVGITAPFLHLSKAEILRAGWSITVPYDLTRTCYKDQETACGRCGSCQERLEAFQLCGIGDPLSYESREIMSKEASV